MEIDITSLLDMDAWPLSHSIAEGGPNAGRDTWKASMQQADETSLLDTEEKVQAFRDWCKDFGAWDDAERAAWTARDANALFLQMVAGDTREAGVDTLADIDWKEYEEMSEAGQWSGNMFQADDGKIYFNLTR